MKIKVQGENQFQVLSHSLTVSPSSEGYTFAYSADGINFTEYEEATPANENLIVNGIAYGQYCKLVGNNSEVTVVF